VSTVVDEDSDRPQTLRAAVRLGKPSRWAAFVLGLAGVGAGALASFKAHLEAPPVALLAVGLILVLVGLAGVLPTRLKVGDNEAEFYQERERQVADVLRKEVEAVTLGDKARVAEIVDRVAEVAPEVAAPAQSALMYDYLVRGLTDDIADEPDIAALANAHPRRHLLLETAYAAHDNFRLPTFRVDHIYEKAVQSGLANSSLLLVTRSPLAEPISTMSKRRRGLYHVIVRGLDDKDALRTAILEASTGPGLLAADLE
jgi:hypothetical protein